FSPWRGCIRSIFPVFPDMKSLALLSRWEPTYRIGKWARGGGWAGMAVIAVIVIPVGAAASLRARMGRSRGFPMTAAHARYMVAPFEALASIPDELSSEDAAPLLCAGITTFNSLRNSGVRAGDLVAVLGIGGLGHLGVQFAAKMGCRTVAIARGQDKAALAR